MATPADPSNVQDDIDALSAQEAQQRMVVRTLKAEGADGAKITEAVEQLKALKIKLDQAVKLQAGPTIDRKALDTVLKRRMFVVQSFEIHGGVAGLFDFGPPGAALKDNVVNLWKRHFIVEDNMLQVECTCMTPEPVLKTSGHVERFTDLMVKDKQNGECFRADKLLETFIENKLEDKKNPVPLDERKELERTFRMADSFSAEEIHAKFQELGIKSPTSGNDLSEPFPFNLMFASTIGPEGTVRSFLRPETAQGIFVNFKRLLDYNNQKMPFAGAQIGLGFRNEISPRAGLIRVREFTMAEIEHFVHPDMKEHEKFHLVADQVLTLFPADKQLSDGKTLNMTIGDAVKQGVVDNETLGYFMARTQMFLVNVGIDPKRLRFRKHLPTEMAHYATECWDAEIKVSYGWVECVGHADRACYDLKKHSEATGNELMASRTLDEPIVQDVAIPKINKGLVGKKFGRESAKIMAAIEEMPMDQALAYEAKLAEEGKISIQVEGNDVELERAQVSWKQGTKKISEERYYPSVIEPSFGIGRIVYAIMEHCFYSREDNEEPAEKPKKKKSADIKMERTVMGFTPSVAPVKCAVFPLMKKQGFEELTDSIAKGLLMRDLTATVDKSGVAIGRKYARADEVGVPFAITVDKDSLEGKGVTLRERDSLDQIRVPVDTALQLVDDVCRGLKTWADVKALHAVL